MFIVTLYISSLISVDIYVAIHAKNRFMIMMSSMHNIAR